MATQALTDLRARINPHLILQTLQHHRIASLSTLAAVIALPFLRNDYLRYLSYGPGGLPYNVVGWLVSTVLLRSISTEQLSTTIYDDPSLPFVNEPGYLPASFPPKRDSHRPTLGSHPVPQRQLDQLPNHDVKDEIVSRFERYGKELQEKGIVEVRQSLAERRHHALFVAGPPSSWHAVTQQTKGEISHVHAGLDATVHVTLSPADCKKVIESGWGLRHGLSGSRATKPLFGFSIPKNYLLIYAPRDEKEIDVVMDFVKASVEFMTGRRDL